MTIQRDLFYGYDTLMENVSDPSHIEFAHHKVVSLCCIDIEILIGFISDFLLLVVKLLLCHLNSPYPVVYVFWVATSVVR